MMCELDDEFSCAFDIKSDVKSGFVNGNWKELSGETWIRKVLFAFQVKSNVTMSLEIYDIN